MPIIADYAPKNRKPFNYFALLQSGNIPARTAPRNRRRAARHRPGHFHGGISNSSAPAIRER
jgi:hypothetical protein